jgi:hypothetical protein
MLDLIQHQVKLAKLAEQYEIRETEEEADDFDIPDDPPDPDSPWENDHIPSVRDMRMQTESLQRQLDEAESRAKDVPAAKPQPQPVPSEPPASPD